MSGLHYVHHVNVRERSANTIQVARMCDAFARAGANVTLWHPAYHAAPLLPEARWRDAYGVGASFRARALPGTAREVGRLRPLVKLQSYARITAELFAAETVFTRCFTAAHYFATALRLTRRGPGLVFEAHDLPTSAARARALSRVDGVVAITQRLAEDIAVRAAPKRTLVAPDGVPAAWLEDALTREQARAQVALEGDHRLVVYTGRLHPGTAQLLADVGRRLAGRARVVAVGMGAEAIHVPEDHLTVRGPVSAAETRALQHAADVLIAPYTRELPWARYTSPIKLFEYMAAGRPVVASHLPVLDEVLRHDDNALLVALDDARALADGVRALLDAPERAERIARRAHADAAQYTWEARAARLLAFFAEVR